MNIYIYIYIYSCLGSSTIVYLIDFVDNLTTHF